MLGPTRTLFPRIYRGPGVVSHGVLALRSTGPIGTDLLRIDVGADAKTSMLWKMSDGARIASREINA
eukprot:6726518-Pyramimonas_sp.AAC.1